MSTRPALEAAGRRQYTSRRKGGRADFRPFRSAARLELVERAPAKVLRISGKEPGLDEEVWVVPRARLFSDEGPQGYVPGVPERLFEAMAKWGRFAARGPVEEDPSLKQIIPYALVASADGRILLVRRASKGGDARLRERFSIGIGGHIEPCDIDEDAGTVSPSACVRLVERALARELAEELEIETSSVVELLGVLNDETNPVGRVHLGLVYRVEIAEPLVRVRETDRLSGGLAGPADLLARRELLETWSAILADRLLGPDGASFSFDRLRRPS